MRRFVLILIAACGGSSGSSGTGESGQTLVVRAVGSPSSTISAPGGTLQLAAFQTVTGPYGSGSTMEEVVANWSSSNTAVATVDPTGLVRGVANGTTVITATAGSGKGQLTITVGGMASLTPALISRRHHLTIRT